MEEGKHVKLLLGGAGHSAVAQPALDLMTSFKTLATAAQIPMERRSVRMRAMRYFLVGAYMFEDVGVTAYHGAAPLLTMGGEFACGRREFSRWRRITRD